MSSRFASCIVAILLQLCCCFALCQTTALEQPSAQRYVCNVGYSAEDCHQQMASLRKVLATYHADKLGEWTWVLVRSEDWPKLTKPRGLDPDSPAFTSLGRRETFFEEALVTPVPGRQGALIVHWSKSSDDLLRLAVTHELGHALCREANEFKADANGERLRRGEELECR